MPPEMSAANMRYLAWGVGALFLVLAFRRGR